jgi:hypothetical protein
MAQNHSYSHDHPNILTAANSMSATLASSVAAHHNTFVPLTLGRSANAIELLVPIAPAVHNATDLKACAFDFLSDLLCQHAEQYSSAELIAACNHIPGTSYNANQEATTICSSLRAAFFTTTNFTDLGLCDNHGRPPITSLITVDPATRPPGIAYFVCSLHCRSRKPSTPASRELVSVTIEFWLALPQAILTTAPATDHARCNLQPHFDSTPASVSQASSTLLVRKTNSDALSADDLAFLGTESSHDTLSEYTLDCYCLFTPLQLQNLLLRNPAPAPAPVPALFSPRMTAVFASTSDLSSSYFGSLEFLDFQVEFDRTFPNPTPLFITPAPSNLSVPLSIDSSIILSISASSKSSFLSTAPIMLALLTAMTPLLFTPQYKH